jgi:tetratricopeptide (TPR) repeat protein
VVRDSFRPDREGHMRIRSLSAILFGSAAIAAFAAPQAQAAVTVLGTGVARSCYEAAEFGGSVHDGIAECTVALDEVALPLDERAATYVNRGILKSRNDDPSGALDDYNRGLELRPNLGEAYVDRGAVMILFQRYDDARADITKGLSLNTNKPEIAYYDRAVADEALGDIRGAYEDCKKAVDLAPDFPEAVSDLAHFKVVIRKHADGT